ncbi:hypothetical protein [Rhodococcus sp. X156]|uniref:hypothetical protein n=1 Tax=Rhodococcus sp. X156 TaxID=2499145 RepID=UPI0013E30C63|nr:hypothetical protein [Rhodococcus sp. X156]
MSLLDRLLHRVPVPEGSVGTLEAQEEVLVAAPLREGHLVATRLGLWVPGDAGPRRLDWHLVSKATWDGAALELVVAEVTGQAGRAVLLADAERHSYALERPGKLPQVVQQRVTSSIRSTHHKALPGGGAWFVQRAVPGRDGVVLQVRVDRGTDAEVVADIAASVAEQLPR